MPTTFTSYPEKEDRRDHPKKFEMKMGEKKFKAKFEEAIFLFF